MTTINNKLTGLLLCSGRRTCTDMADMVNYHASTRKLSSHQIVSK